MGVVGVDDNLVDALQCDAGLQVPVQLPLSSTVGGYIAHRGPAVLGTPQYLQSLVQITVETSQTVEGQFTN